MADPARRPEVQRGAEPMAKLLSQAGFGECRSSEGGAPAVIARHPAPAGAPTVLLYAHHDVQPEGDHSQWSRRRSSRPSGTAGCTAAAAADDKAGITTHLAALRALRRQAARRRDGLRRGRGGVRLALAPGLLAAHGALAADVIVIADSDNWRSTSPR